jgi:hypothetical protein
MTMHSNVPFANLSSIHSPPSASQQRQKHYLPFLS